MTHAGVGRVDGRHTDGSLAAHCEHTVAGTDRGPRPHPPRQGPYSRERRAVPLSSHDRLSSALDSGVDGAGAGTASPESGGDPGRRDGRSPSRRVRGTGPCAGTGRAPTCSTSQQSAARLRHGGPSVGAGSAGRVDVAKAAPPPVVVEPRHRSVTTASSATVPAAPAAGAETRAERVARRGGSAARHDRTGDRAATVVAAEHAASSIPSPSTVRPPPGGWSAPPTGVATPATTRRPDRRGA